MLFNSFEFAIFFPIVVALYFSLPYGLRLPLLLAASCLFYMAFIPVYILIIFITIGIDYVAGIYIEKTQGKARLYLLWMSIVSTCAVLFVFKYYNFFTGSFSVVANSLGFNIPRKIADIILPIGLSFHTFQSLSYVLEVYWKRQKAEKNLVTYATYVMFFPQLVAGPIERPQNLLHQFYERHDFNYDQAVAGLKRMALGFFKKVVIADRLALYVNDVYASPRNFNGLQLSIATFFFAYQIYCDFSGYTDIALGTAQILGFHLMENFDTPYYSRSISEFWHRWHISLSTWFRDYLYIPMGGSRVKLPRWCFNILVTFAVSGLWHGANWTYVVWGLLNGFYLLTAIATGKFRGGVYSMIGLGKNNPLRVAINIGSTFFLTCVGWAVFRARNLSDAAYVLTHFMKNWNFHEYVTPQFLTRQFPVALGAIIVLEFIQLFGDRLPALKIRALPLLPRWALYIGFVLAVIMFGVYQKTQFIYFQF